MRDAIAPSGTVHWAGTGLSTGAGLRVLAGQAPRVVVWGRTAGKAGDCLARLRLSGRAATRAYTAAALAAELRAGDVVVSMLPATHHRQLLRLCVSRGAHFACSSYVSEAIAAQAGAAEQAGVAVLTEAGLDPGIDHLFADLLVAKARAVLGDRAATADFTSYCGGVPAVPNEFRYRFSWAPRGVLTALLAPARYIDEGVEKVAEFPWEATRGHALGGQRFEVYPNRDSIPYLARYAIPGSWRLTTFVRGTLRLDGWRQAWDGVFTRLRAAGSEEIAALADELAAAYPTTGADRDRVVLAVALGVRGDGAAAWYGEYLLDVAGTPAESAMARCVSLPLAFGVTEILAGKVPAGLRQGADGAHNAQRWLEFLARNDIACQYRDTPREPFRKIYPERLPLGDTTGEFTKKGA